MGDAGLERRIPSVSRSERRCVQAPGQPAVVHDIDSEDDAEPYLYFGAGGGVKVKIAGGDLSQTNGDSLNVSGLAEVRMGAGQSSAGESAPARPLRTRLLAPSGTDVTADLVTTP